MARVLSYERVVDAVLIHTNPALDTEIQNKTKIKEEPIDTTSNTDTTEDYTLVRNCFSLIDHDYHHYRDESSLSENNISRKNINNKENKQLSNSHSIYSNDVNKTVNLERKSAKTKKEQIRNTLSQLKKKRKYSTETPNNKNTITLRTTITENVRGKIKQQSTTECKTKIQHTTGSARKKFTECDICFREFSSVRNCEAHKQYYEFVGDYNCRICKKHYVTREKLHSHKCQRIHNARTSSYNYNCNFCSRAFKSKAFLQSHLFHIHSELIYSSNTNKHKNLRSENVNTSPGDDTLGIDAHEESLCLNNLIKSEQINTTPTKRLRQPTLTEYLELCKKKRDIKLSSNKLNIMKDDFPTCAASHHDEEIKGNSKLKLSEEYNGQIDSLSMKSDNLPEQTACSTLEENIKHETCSSKKPYVKLHADVEMMKSFLEKLSDTVVKNKVTEDQTNNIVSYDREIPYSLRSLRVISSVKTGSNSGMRKSKNVSKESRFNIEFSTKKEQNVIDSDKVDSKINWKSIMTRFKCKECTIPLIKCDKQPRNSYQSSAIDAIKNTSLITQCNFTLFQENEIRDKLILKDLEVSLERLTAVPIVDIKAKTRSDVEKRSCFLCKICKKSFSSKLAIRIHFKSSHIAYMSSICDARYTLKHKLFRHYLREHSFKQNQCSICYMSLPDYEALKQHLNVHCLKYIQREDDQYPIDIELKCNLTKKPYKCLHCHKTFSLQSSLLAHQSYCTVQEEMEDQQDFMKNTSASSKNIIKVQHNENTDENIVTCDERTHFDNLCEPSNSDFVTKSNEHRILLVSEEEPKVNEDSQNFNNNSLIEKKIETINESQNFKKFSENNSTISKQNIANAQLSDIPIRTMTYPCAICGKQFHNPKNLEVHIRTFSFTTDICPMCGTGFSSKRLLQTHIAAAHVPQISKTYSFHCVFCNQGFFKKHDLRPHILHLHGQQVLNTLTRNPNMCQEKSNESVTHTATCNVCNLVFETHDRYVEHRMYYYKNHTFTCSLCAQNFQGMYMFHHHNKLTHYSENKRKSYSYICDICNEGFNHESHFYSHNMHVHSNEVNLVETAKESEERSCFNHASHVQKQIRNCSTDKQAEQPSKYICQICQLKCIDMNDMARHRELYSNDGDFKCDKCNRQCVTFYLLDQHRKLTHFCRDIYNGHACHICGEVLETIIALKCHEKHFHSNITSNNADNLKNCGQTSSNITCKAMEHPCESMNNTCNVAKYNCLFCDMKFSTANTVQTHIVHVHMDDMIAKRATLKLTLPIIDNNDIQKQFVETIDQAPLSSSSSSSSSSSLSSSEANRTQLQRSITQRSNNMLSNVMAKNGINDKTTIELLRKFRAIHPKNNKITETTSIPAITCINRSEDNISTFGIVTSSMKSKADSSVSLSTGSTTSRIAASNVEFKTNTSVLLSTGSTIFKTPSTISKDNTSVLLSSGSTNEFKDNSTSSSSRSIIIDKCKIAPVCPLPTGSLRNVVLQSWKSNDVTNQRSESVNSYSHGYSCPLCSLEYPSLMFFHAHLKYAHADSIRTNELIIPQMNHAQKTSMIECLLCPCIFIDETKYKKHLRNTHTYYVYIPNSEEIAKINNVSNSLTQTNVSRSTIPETITVDDDNDNDNVENTLDQRPEVIATLDHKRQNEKIGKLRVKPFAKIIENLSTDSALKLL